MREYLPMSCRLLAGGMMLALAGCTGPLEYVTNGFKVGPNYGKPPAAVAEHWIDATDKRLRQEPADLSHWWSVFNDPLLENLIVTAYGQNLTLREAGFRVLQARAMRGIAVGGLFPQQQDASGSYTHNAVSRSVANRIAIPDQFFDNWSLGFGLAWELDFWGRFRRAIASASDALDASVEGYDDVLVTLISDVAGNYIQYRVYRARIELARQNVIQQEINLKIVRARFEGGQTTKLDVDQAVSDLSQTQALIPQLEIGLRQVNNRLCILLGTPPADLERMLGQAGIPIAPPEVVVGIPAELLTRRPDVRRAERLAAAQSEQIGIAVSELYPHLAIAGNIGWQAENFGDLFKSKALAGSVGPSFQWNVLHYGRLANNVRLQDARFQELIATYQNTVLRANEEVENGLVAFLKSQQRVRFLAESVAASQDGVKIGLVQYQQGKISYTAVALLIQNLVTQQDALAQAQGDIALGLVQVYRALGGGWQVRLCPPPVTPGALPNPGLPLTVPPVDPDKKGGADGKLPQARQLPNPDELGPIAPGAVAASATGPVVPGAVEMPAFDGPMLVAPRPRRLE